MGRQVSLAQVKAGLATPKKARRRQRELPAHGVVYDVIAGAWFLPVSYREGFAVAASDARAE